MAYQARCRLERKDVESRLMIQATRFGMELCFLKVSIWYVRFFDSYPKNLKIRAEVQFSGLNVGDFIHHHYAWNEQLVVANMPC